MLHRCSSVPLHGSSNLNLDHLQAGQGICKQAIKEDNPVRMPA